jgi:hypothetical protein
MIRSIPIVMLACCLTACSGSSPSQSSTSAGNKAAPAPTADSAPQPAQPAAAPEAKGAAPASPASPAAQTGQPGSPATPEPAVIPAPTFQEITIPADTSLTITLVTPIASDTSKVEDQVRGTLAKPLVLSGKTVVPTGAEVVGSILEAERSGRVKGRASIAFQFERLVVRGESHAIRTVRIAREAAADRKGDVKKGGIGAGVGAVIGGIAGGGKGAAIGGVIGGTGAVVATRGKEVRLPAGSTVTTRLRGPLTMQVPIAKK